MSDRASQANEREFAFTEEDFQFLSKLAYSRTGIVLADHKRDMVYGRLARRLRALGLHTFTEYCELLQSEHEGEEITHLVNAITTNLTSFFREGHHFDHLRDQVLKPLANAPGKKRLRIWSAACSSGMEPYSIGMTMRMALPDIDRRDARVLATDIDSNMLRTASEGEYPLTEMEHIPQSCQQYVETFQSQNRLRVQEKVRGLISFKHLNLLETWPMKGPFDIIFCRNVVIYFDKPTKQKLFDRMADILAPQGWLYIGHSENLHGISTRFEPAGRTIYRRIA